MTSATVRCANCGDTGHVYKACNHPITSFGVICMRLAEDSSTPGRIQYLMVRRKDSLCFVEFMRGKYTLENRDYMYHLFSNMTQEERERIATCPSFDDLWHGFCKEDRYRHYVQEYQVAKQQFGTLRSGYKLRVHPDLRAQGADEIIDVTLERILTDTSSSYVEPEWGFPKGRRNINESNLKCALREFREETGVDTSRVRVLLGGKSFEETFVGCNKVRYRHEYFLAVHERNDGESHKESSESKPAAIEVVPLRTGTREGVKQASEISCVAWMDAEEVLGKLRPRNVERISLFRRLHDMVGSNFEQYFSVAGRCSSGDSGCSSHCDGAIMPQAPQASEHSS